MTIVKNGLRHRAMPSRAGYRSLGAHLAREYGGLVLGGARVAVIGLSRAMSGRVGALLAGRPGECRSI